MMFIALLDTLSQSLWPFLYLIVSNGCHPLVVEDVNGGRVMNGRFIVVYTQVHIYTVLLALAWLALALWVSAALGCLHATLPCVGLPGQGEKHFDKYHLYAMNLS